MSWFLGDEEPVPVPLGVCLCPGTPHAGGDTVHLRPALDVGGGLLVAGALSDDDGTIVERLGRAYLVAGIVSWTFTDARGEPVPVTPRNILRLRFSGPMVDVADKAASLYGDTVLTPLVERVSASLPNGPSVPSTSPTPRRSRSRRKP